MLTAIYTCDKVYTMVEKTDPKIIKVSDDLHAKLSRLKGLVRCTFSELIHRAICAYEREQLSNKIDLDKRAEK